MMEDEIMEYPQDVHQEEEGCVAAASCPRPAMRHPPVQPTPCTGAVGGQNKGALMPEAENQPSSHSRVHILGLAPLLKDQSQGARAHNPPSQRMRVRPFFCCGSELSLVSLMDNVDLSGPAHSAASRAMMREAKHSLSDSEDTADGISSPTYFCEDDYGATCGSGASIQTVCGMGKAGGGAVVRRVKSDKRKSKKHFWSLRFGKKAVGGGAGVKLSEVRKSVCGQCGSKKCHGSQGARCQATCHKGHQMAYHSLGRGVGGDMRASVVGVFPINGTDELLAGERSLDRTATRGRASCDMTAFMDRTATRGLASCGMTAFIDRTATRGRASCDMTAFMDHIRQTPLSQLSTRMHGNTTIIYREATLQPAGTFLAEDFVTADMAWERAGGLVHTRMDFVHHLVPDLAHVTACSFYWGVMDRYQAERLLQNKREGTFLLRDSAQDDFLFSVSFRRYNRSLHARIEQWNHRFSFDIHDPAVYSADSVCGLIEHYKDSSRCMFFEPMLTEPLHRNFPFSLQHLARAAICNNLSRYDHISRLPLPSTMKAYLRYYHYKQKVCIRSFEDPSL